MASNRIYRRRNEAAPSDPKQNPFAATNDIFLDDSDEEETKTDENTQREIRMRKPSLQDPFLNINSSAYRRKYSVALQTLKPFRPASKDGTMPINKASLFSFIFMSWLSPLVWRLFKKRGESVAEDDIWACADEEACNTNTERLLRYWNEELKTKGPEKASFVNVWRKFIQTRALVGLCLMTVNAIATFMGSAYLLELIVSYLESTESDFLYAIGMILAVTAAEIVRACSMSNVLVTGSQTGTRFRSGLMGLAYNKLLKLKNLKGKTTAEVINLFGVDSYRVYVASFTSTFVLSLPIFLIIGLVYGYTLIGPWSFLAIGTFFVCYILQARLTNGLRILRQKSSLHTDKRVRKMGEVLNSIKLIKMYAWEYPFATAIKGIRKVEQKYLLYSAMLNAVIGSVIPVTPTIATVVTISVYTAAGNSLNASTAFAIVGTMNFLRAIVTFIPFALRAYSEAQVSFVRMKRILLLDEYSPPPSDCRDKRNVIELQNASFVWHSEDAGQNNGKNVVYDGKKKDLERKGSVASIESSTLAGTLRLSNIDLCVKKSRLIGICGSVGCGKSSLLSAILGRMTKISGHIAVNGSVAYVAQQAWIFNGTLKENILLGKDYNAKRYMDVISACALEPDLEQLPDRDETEIGERGANISGGQKQRVSLARAVYSDSDIYILDDPLSAVDVRVGKMLFHQCIRGALREKTVLLATHQLQYLRHCNEIVVMDEGIIVESGTHLELLNADGAYSKMFRTFEITSIKAKEHPENTADGTDKIADEANDTTVTYIPTGILKKSKPKKGHNAKGKLTESEEAAVGEIKFSTYVSYINAAGGWFLVISVILLYVIASGSVVFSDWWLSQWIDSLSKVPPSATPDIVFYTNYTYLNATTVENATIMEDATAMDVVTKQEITTDAMNSSTNFTADGLVSGTITYGLLQGISYDTFFIVYIVSLAGIIFLQIAKGFAGARASIRASSRIHARVLDKVMAAPMSFFDANPSGRILNRFSKDLDEGDVFLPQMSDAFLWIGTLVLASIALTAYTLPWILVAVFPLWLIYWLLSKMASVSTRQLKRLENIARSPLINHVNSSAQGLPTIVAYGQEKSFFDNCKSLTDVASVTIFLSECSMRWLALRLDLASSMLTIATAAILVFSKGFIAPAIGGLVLGLCGKTVVIMQYLVRIMNETEARFTSIERLHEYEKNLESEPQLGKDNTTDTWPEHGEVVFSDAELRYRPDKDPVLKNVSFHVKAEEKVGIVGRTGAGKSSLAVALFRLADLSSGQILIDGVDISQIPLQTLRSRISSIPQDPVLFAGNMRYNIDPFCQSSDDELWDALEKVHMKEKIQQFEEGLDVMIEENGENFSVGERQLICLARAVLKKNKILLLDEATANIDTTTDAMIQQTIRECFSNCTVLTIAHRLNTVLHSDKLIVLEAGKVMECGTPQDLLVDPFSYFNGMIRAQTVKTPSP